MPHVCFNIFLLSSFLDPPPFFFSPGEFGSGTFSPNTDTHISFKTEFQYVPGVTLALAGFVAHLDVNSYDSVMACPSTSL